MSVLTRLFPSACSRLRVFICYAREDKALAVDIAHTLTNAGHDVFIDANSLKVATDFNEEIRNAIRRADRFIFLASRNSLARGAYPLTELGFAEKRWPAAKGAIWPVIVDPSVDAAELPSYLRAVQVHVPKGNVVADLAAEIDGSRTVRSSCLLAALALIALPVIAAGVVSNARYASYALVPPRQVVFLPTKKPGPDESWMTSPVALTVVPVSYNNDGRRDVRIVSETVRLPVESGRSRSNGSTRLILSRTAGRSGCASRARLAPARSRHKGRCSARQCSRRRLDKRSPGGTLSASSAAGPVTPSLSHSRRRREPARFSARRRTSARRVAASI